MTIVDAAIISPHFQLMRNFIGQRHLPSISKFVSTLIISAIMVGCAEPEQIEEVEEVDQIEQMQYVMDVHSHSRPTEARTTHMRLEVAVYMEKKFINGVVTYDISHEGADEIIFDTDGLKIHAVKDENGEDMKFELKEPDQLGAALVVQLNDSTSKVAIAYTTGEDASALQWLSPNQTSGGEEPFLFTQGQAILTRSWIPLQDSPGVRFTYEAKVRVPQGLMAVMSATNPTEKAVDGIYRFRMDQPIPGYLMALAVGDIAFQEVGPRTGVYAEPQLLEKAAYEFGDMEAMLTAAEGLYGPYQWDRYDVIVLPPSFPFGGMENPRLTFATPTILAGDRSLNSLIAHELAHSWSGNLVTNATWDDFWLNEGFTVYFEHRISEAVYGEDFANMLGMLGYQDLQRTMNDIHEGDNPHDTHLKLDLKGRNPDDGMTEVAYEKGNAFLRAIEAEVGREKFDTFLKEYFDRFSFQTMTTERFLEYLDDELLVPNQVKIDVDKWVYGKGVPEGYQPPTSDRFVKVEKAVAEWIAGKPASELPSAEWTTFEWMHFLRSLPADLSSEQMKQLDSAFDLTEIGNSEIIAIWLEIAVRNRYEPAYERLDDFLTTVGRRKFLTPLYKALVESDQKDLAMDIYKGARPNYHSVSRNSMDELLHWGEF